MSLDFLNICTPFTFNHDRISQSWLVPLCKLWKGANCGWQWQFMCEDYFPYCSLLHPLSFFFFEHLYPIHTGHFSTVITFQQWSLEPIMIGSKGANRNWENRSWSGSITILSVQCDRGIRFPSPYSMLPDPSPLRVGESKLCNRCQRKAVVVMMMTNPLVKRLGPEASLPCQPLLMNSERNKASEQFTQAKKGLGEFMSVKL